MKNRHIVVANGLGAHGRPVQQLLEREGYAHVSYVASGSEALTLCRHTWVDLLLLDMDMPDMEGIDVLERLVPAVREGRLQIVAIADPEHESDRDRALELGVREFLTEPVDPAEVRLRVHNALAASMLEGELIARNTELAEAIASHARELSNTRREILHHLAIAAEIRDDETGEHTRRVGRTAALIARGCGIQRDVVALLAAAAPLHDVGKIGIPDSVLLKRGALTRSEHAVMRTHTRLGAQILSESEVPELRLAETVALRHHERWDGTGYPEGLSGREIPFAARLVAIADAFDALIFARSYKPAWPIAEAVSEVRAQSARQFDPELVRVFLTLEHSHLGSPIAPLSDAPPRQLRAPAAALRASARSDASAARAGRGLLVTLP